MSMSPFSHMQSQLQKRPRMLKDFLQDDANSTSRYLVPKVKPQSRSRSAFQAMVNALIKNIPFSAVTSPSILPRSLSRKLPKKHGSRNSKTDGDGEMRIITVRVKDIMRWKSFRDLVEEKSQPLDLSFASSPLRCTTNTTTTTTSGSCSSRGSSWSDSDFTSEYLSDEEEGKKNLPSVGADYLETTTETEGYNSVGPKDDVVCDEEEQQHSPHSVLDFESRDAEEPFPHFREWGLLGHTKELCVREMDKGGRWSKFDEEQQDLCLEIEKQLFGSLIDELARDLIQYHKISRN